MEGGGISQRSKVNYTDHLATGSVAVTESANKNSKQWLTSGFNGFGQLGSCPAKLLYNNVKNSEFKKSFVEHNKLSCSWSYLASASEYSLQLQGLFSESTNTVTITTKTAIKSLASCDRFCLILMENGKVYKLLPQQCPLLEEVKFQVNEKSKLPPKSSVFNKRDYNCGFGIVHIACGNNIMVAIGNSNEVFSGTAQTDQFPKYIGVKQLVCGFEHALLLTCNGDVYTWGNGLRGQLGQKTLKVEEKPIIVEALAGIKITYITSSGWHNAAISVFRDLYTWGFNSNGQLGLRIYKNEEYRVKQPVVYPLPQLVDLPICCCSQRRDTSELFEQNCFPIKVVAGARHTILLMTCGTYYACGWNAYGQLGIKQQKSFCDSFQYMLKVEKEKADAIEIVCGSWCTIIGIH